MTTLETRILKIFKHHIKVSIMLEGKGQNVNCFIHVNSKRWTAWNLCNYRINPNESFNQISEILEDGSYQMFI